MNIQGKGKGFSMILSKCDVMTYMILMLVYDVFYAIVHDILKSGLMHGFLQN